MTYQDPQEVGQLEAAQIGPVPVKGWLDDLWTICLILPCLLAFVPGLQDVVSRGFQIIGQDVPGWYLTALGASLAAAFGRSVIPGGFAGLIGARSGKSS